MCEQSLVEYLKTKLPDTANRDHRIEELVTMDEASFREQDHNKRRDWKKDLGQEQVVRVLDELQILDPAVGSGAFPMGMLNLLVKVYTRIDTAREKDLAQLKRDILSRSLYGVDIDQMAIQISRLRAWLSILVDMENLKKVEPLPNLDFKFVCANTLIPLDEGSNGLFDDDINLKDNLIKLRDQYYAATRKTDKEKIRKEYLKLINTGSLFASQRELQLKDYNPFNPLNSSSFYDPALMHGVEAFDVVIGNPPYFVYQGHNKSEIDVLKNISIYDKSQGGKLNAFKLFLARGSNLSKKNGLLGFIFQNSFLSDNGSKKIRQFFLNDQRIIKIDSFPERDSMNKRVFEAVKMSVCIMLSKNIKKDLYDFDLYVWGDKYKKSGWNVSFSNKELLEYDAASQQIPYLQEKEKNLFKKFFIRTDIEKIKCYEGELNMTFHKHLFTKDASCPKIMKGAQIQRYYVTDNMSQGELEYLNEDQYLQNNRGEKSTHHMHNRIAIQGISGVNDKVRIISTMVTSGAYLANSCNYIVSTPEGYSIYSVLGILNSRFINYIFKKTSTNSNVNTYEISNLNFIKSDNKNSDQIKKIDQNVFNILKIKENNFKTSTLDLESQVDELVMDLYGLNEEEKEIIRNS
jgi:Alw26I/Eco31I/Esp3I family type II restriction m6 adenine DNA methyltransferase